MRAVALVRVSTEAQAGEDRGGLRGQREEIRRIADAYGLDIVEWVELEGVSGAAVMADPRFSDLLSRLRDVEAVIVAAFDRLMRPEKMADYAILDAFRESGTKLFTPEGPRDLENDRLLSVIQGEIGHLERKSIRARTERGKSVLTAAGFNAWGGNLPWAVTYRVDEVEGRKVPVWEYKWPEAGIVKQVYERLCAGERNFSRLSRELRITRTHISRIVRNPIYKGVRQIDMSSDRKTVANKLKANASELKIIDLPLVDPDAWEMANRALEGRPPPLKEGPPWVYRGYLLCGSCGCALHVRTDRGAPRYRCRSAVRRDVKTCSTGDLPQPAVDAAVDRVLAEQVGDPAQLAALIEAALAPTRRARQDVDAEKEIGKLTRERERVITGYERGMRTLAQAESRCRQIDAQVDALRCMAAESEAAPADLEPLVERFVSVLGAWGALSFAEKRRLLPALLRSVTVERAGRAQVRVVAVDLAISAFGPSSSGRGRGRCGGCARRRCRAGRA